MVVRRNRLRPTAGLLLAALSWVAGVAAQEPVGEPFWIHEYADGAQRNPVVIPQSDGTFVVLWDSDGPDGNRFGVRMRRFSDLGLPLTAELPVNETTAGNQMWVDADFDSEGSLIVVWISAGGDHVFVRFFEPDLTPLTSEIQLTTAASTGRFDLSVDARPDGRYVVSWREIGGEIRVAVFDSPAVAVVAEQAANPAIPTIGGVDSAMQDDGSFAVSWRADWDDGFPSTVIYLRLFDAFGDPVTSELLVSVPSELQASYAPELISVPGIGYRSVWQRSENLGQDRKYSAIVSASGSVGAPQPIGVAADVEGSITFAALDRGDFVLTAGTSGHRYDSAGNLVATFYPFLLDNAAAAPIADSTGELVVIKPVPTGNNEADLIAQVLSASRLFADGFESGDASAWSTSVP